MIPFVLHADDLLQVAPDSVLSDTIGRPTVAYDPSAGEYVMFVETRLSTDYYDSKDFQQCTWGVWGLVRATSPDGLQWDVDPRPVVMPQPGTDFACVLAHPNVIFDGQTWHLWVKTEKGGGAPYTGIAYATSFDGIHFSFREELILRVQAFGEADLLALGYPTVVMLDDVWRMLVAKQYIDGSVSLLAAYSDDLGRSWKLDQDPAIDPGGADWVPEHVYNPTLLCEDDPEKVPLTLFYAGRDSAWNEVGFGKASSADGVRWTNASASPYFTWVRADGEMPWIHWTALRAGDEYVVYFTERRIDPADGVEKPYLRAAYTTPDWDEAQVSPRICPPPTAAGPYEPPEDTDSCGDIVCDDTDDDGDDEVPGCQGCQTTSPAGQAAAWALALGIVLLLRGRQRV